LRAEKYRWATTSLCFSLVADKVLPAANDTKLRCSLNKEARQDFSCFGAGIPNSLAFVKTIKILVYYMVEGPKSNY
jgi:hypothetical protein